MKYQLGTHLDEDGQQEYALALLEGCDEEAARKRGWSAHNRNSSKRQLRTRYLLYSWIDEKSAQPKSPWAATDPVSPEKEAAALALLGYCTERQRAVIEARLGMTTGHPLKYREIGEMFGVNPANAFDCEQRGLNRIRREISRPPMEEVDRQRLERKREYNRKFMARKRAEQKENQS